MRKLLCIILLTATSYCNVLHAQQSETITSKNLNEVEITATAKPSTAQSTTPLQILSEEDIIKQGIQSVSDAVKRFNGVVLKDYGGIGGLKTVSIRGMGAEYTSISYDGMVVNNFQSGQVDIGRFTLDNISMLSLSIGQADDIFQSAKSHSTTGVLNLQTKKPQFGNQKNKLHTKIATGSFGYFEPMIDHAYKVNDKLVIATNVNWQRADGKFPFKQDDDQFIRNRKRKNSDIDVFRSEINLYSKLSKNDHLDAKLYYYDSERGLPGSVIIGTDRAKERVWDKNAFTQISYNKTINTKMKFKSLAKYDYLYNKYKEDVLVNNINSYNRYKQQEVYWSNMGAYDILESLSVSLAQDISYNALKSEFTRLNDNQPQPKRFNSYTALTLKYQIQNFTIIASGLGTYVDEQTKNKTSHTIFKKISPALSLSYKPLNTVNWRMRTSYKHLYRIPTFTELYYVATGKALDPESSSQYNIGSTWIANIDNSPIEYINISVDAYYNDVSNKIIIYPTQPLPTSFNMGKVEMKGIDIKLSTKLNINTRLSFDIIGAYSYLDAYDADKENVSSTYKHQLPYTPKHSGSATLAFNNPWVNISYSALFSDIRYSSRENLPRYKVDAYSDHSVTLHKDLKINNNLFYSNGTITNIWNKNYNVIAYYPMPRRAFRVVIGYKF